AVLSQALLRRSDKPGRVAAYEFLVVTPAIANLIRENKTFRINSDIQTGASRGMIGLDAHLLGLFSRNLISADEALGKSQTPDSMRVKLLENGATFTT
ncbi:MAG: type IV pili twitching motility protein PilT, partial [Verrucomicrobiota bacterium]|nr:type IV pili twitching motility protein PilT [Verrucomicrobiota bacterium]